MSQFTGKLTPLSELVIICSTFFWQCEGMEEEDPNHFWMYSHGSSAMLCLSV